MNSTSNKWLILLTVASGTFISAMSTSIVNVSIPSLMLALNAELHQVEWVVTAFMIAFTVTLPLTNWLKHKFSNRLLFVVSLAIHSFGALLCGLSDSLSFLIFARVVQALGGGALAPVSMAIVTDTFEQKERGRAFGIWGLGVVIGPSIGPTLGGYLSETLSWRWIFFINVPLGLLAMTLGWIYLRQKKVEVEQNLKFDLKGFVTITISIVSLLLGLSMMAEHASISSWLMIFASVASMALFIRIERKTSFPLWDLSLFTNKIFMNCIAITFVRSVALFGGVFLLPLFLQGQMHLSEYESGLVMLPGSLMLAVMMPFTGTLSDKGHTYALTSSGLVTLALSFIIFAGVDANSSPWLVMIILIIRGIGLGLLLTPLSAMTMTSVQPAQSAMAASISNLAQQLGGSFGIAFLVLLKSLFFASVSENAELISLHWCFVVAGVMVLLSLFPAKGLKLKPIKNE